MTSLEIGLLVLAVMLLGYFLGRVTAPDPPAPPPPPMLVPPLPTKPDGPTPDLLHIESLNGPVLILRGTLIEAANSAARSLLGERVLGSDIRLTVRHPALLDAVDQVMADGASDEREITGLGIGGLGGGNRSFRLRALADDSGRCIVLLDDVTQAKATERMRVDFVANASHELRTPLATLTGFIETLQGPAAEDAPARQRFLTIMAQEADRMRRLIDDLMSLSRIELDKFIRPNQPLALTGIAAEVARTLAMRLDADQRQLLIEEPSGLPSVMADRDQVLQVLHNLVSNALKYGRSGTPITVTMAQADDMVRISVRDIGEGIAPEHLPRLTERFYRVDSQRSRTMGGTGLGLAIVKHIVERHRGRLEIDSSQGEGTVVSFSLPVAP
jgi:two-component system phosphate regulon sensor histidine kinase PhoR